MYLLLCLSVLSFTVMIERGLTIREAAANAENLLGELRPLLHKRRFAGRPGRMRAVSRPGSAPRKKRRAERPGIWKRCRTSR
jgi:hypothetical protein